MCELCGCGLGNSAKRQGLNQPPRSTLKGIRVVAAAEEPAKQREEQSQRSPRQEGSIGETLLPRA